MTDDSPKGPDFLFLPTLATCVAPVTMFGRVPLFLFLTAISAIRILQVNDDGWAELYARALNSALRAAGHNAILVAPAIDRSRTGKSLLFHVENK